VNKNKQTYFSSILENYHRQEFIDGLKHLGLEFLAMNSAYLLFCLVIESLWFLPPVVKSVLWLLFAFNAVFLFRIAQGLYRSFAKNNKENDEALLLYIGQQFPTVMDKLLNHYQLSKLNDPISKYAVEAFINENPLSLYEQSFKKRPIKKKRHISLIIFGVLLVFSILSLPAFSRLVHATKAYEPTSPFHVDIYPHEIEIYTYDSLSFRVFRSAPERFPLEIYIVNEEQGESELLLRTRDSIVDQSLPRLKRSATIYARLRRPNLFYPRKYIDTDTLTVKVLQRPKIRSLDFVVRSPEYSEIPEALYQGNIDRITCLNGSEIDLLIKLSENVGTSYLLHGNDTLEIAGEGSTGKLTWTPRSSEDISLLLTNKKGIKTETQPSYRIELETDKYPGINIISPRADDEILLTEDLQLPYLAHLQDDYGLSSFKVLYNVYSEYSYSLDTTYQSIELNFDPRSRLQTAAGVWEIKQFISPGSELRYYFELCDNDLITGPKTVRSSYYYAKLPSLGDLFALQDEAQKETMANLESELLSTEDIVEELDEIQKQLLQEGEMDWENKTALEENLNALEKTKQDLQEIQKSMDEQKKFMDENALFSDEVMQSFEQLQELMNELIDDELFELMKDLQDKLERNDTSNMEEILEDFTDKAKRFEESLDRMLEIFKRIQQEQRLEELGQQLKSALQEQEKLVEEVDNNSSDDLADMQEKIKKETEDLEKLIEESKELFDDEDRKAYEEFLEKMKEFDPLKNMDQAGEQYQQGNKQSGKKESQDAKDKLQSLQNEFSMMASSMMQKQKNEVSQAFQRAFHKTLFASFEQEQTIEMGKDLTNLSPMVHTFTSKEEDILQLCLDINVDLLELSKKTFLVDKSIGQALGSILANLRTGIQEVEEAKISHGRNNFKAAYKSMNDLARILLERLNMVKDQQQGNASGMEFYMQQLQEMAGQQQQLNSSMPTPGMDGSPGSSMMEQLAKMAARQQALRRSLKQMQQGKTEGDSGKRMMGDLDRIAKDMEDVINQMRNNKVNRQTIMRQEKIVQRLLDASRSATSRDYKKERESTTGKDILRENPLSLPGDLGDHETLINQLRREVQNSDLSPQEKLDMERYLESLLGQKFSPEKKK
jgi:hypothetical protein